MSAPTPEHPPAKEVVRPRTNPQDAFEQNPLTAVEERLHGARASQRHTPEEDQKCVEEAVRRVIEDGAIVGDVAREFGLAPSSIYQWRKRYIDFLQAGPRAETAAPVELVSVPDATRQRFADNWARLLEETHATASDFKQDSWMVFLQTSPGTRWMFAEDGRLERGTLVGAIIAVVGVAAVLTFLISSRGGDRLAGDPVKPAPVEAGPRHDLEIERASEVVKQFLQAKNWEQKLTYIHGAGTVREQVREFYGRHSDASATDGSLQMGMVNDGVVSVSYDVPSRQQRLFFHLIQEDGIYKIDWQSSSLFQEDNIERFLSGKSSKPTVLVVKVARGNYYNHQWSDASRYQCFELTFPGNPQMLYGYAPVDSPVGTELRILTGFEKSRPIVLEARFPENPKDDRQVEVVRVVREEWLDR